jgi:hypothetical protein
MHSRRGIALALLATSCGGGGGGGITGPNPPATPTQSLALTSASPSSGTLVLRDCPVSGSTPLCTQDLRLQFTATFDRAIAQSSVFVEFYSAGGLRCAVAVSAPSQPLSSGVATAYNTTVSFGSLPPQFPQFCTLPVTTTRVVAYLQEGSSVRVLTREFSNTYTWTVASGSGGEPTPNPTPTPRPNPTPTPAPPGNVCAMYPRGGDAYNCGDFPSREEAQRYHDQCDQNDRNNMDGDGDGRVCE